MSTVLRTAQEALVAAETVVMRYWRSTELDITAKKNPRDLVTQADVAADHAIRDVIQRNEPNHLIYSEELSHDSTNAEYVWVVDPIDGTINFTMGEPNFGISIGLLHHGEPVLGMISIPAIGERYWAEQGKGAWMSRNNITTPLHVSSVDRVSDVRCSIGYNTFDASRQRAVQLLPTLITNTAATRINYCFVFDAMNVARGGMDAYINLDVHLWDFGAGWCIVNEAGGAVVNLQTGAPMRLTDADILVSNGRVTNAMVELIHTPLL